jgi:hypothetical protein
MSFKDALAKLDDAVKDLTTLTVRTFGGNLDSIVNVEGADFKKALDQAKTAGTIKLLMRTEISADSDTDLFVADGTTADVRAIHLGAVEAALKARQAVVDMALRMAQDKL